MNRKQMMCIINYKLIIYKKYFYGKNYRRSSNYNNSKREFVALFAFIIIFRAPAKMHLK